jgi:hypothetical protein
LTLKATVTSGGNPVGHGLVTFCNASAPYCEDTAVLGTASLTSSGFATLHLTLGPGPHNITAIFRGTSTYAASISSVQAITVTTSSTTTITSSGSAGNYSLTGTVAANGAIGPTGAVSFLDASNANFLLGSAALGSPTIQTSSLSFTGSTPLTGQGGTGVAVGDFNGDGNLDFAITSCDAANITIMLGKGNGTFTSSSITVGGCPWDVVAGDFNGDGKLDLAYADEDSNVVNILLGNGDGTFTQKSSVAGGSVVVGDFNGDGILDLAVGNNGIDIYLGNGDGTFTLKTTIPGYSPVAAADVNGDGILDLVAESNTLTTENIFLGKGDGTFTLASTITFSGPPPVGVAIGDFNGDGKPDLAVITYGDLSIYLGNGAGTFTYKSYVVPQFPAFSPTMVVVGDFNGDGKLDVAYTDQDNDTVSVALGNGDGTFAQAMSAGGTGIYAIGLAVGDFNGDGKPDIVNINNYSGSSTPVGVFLNQMSTVATAATSISGVSVPGGGTHNVLASYGGDSNYTASQSSTIPLTGSAIITTTTLAVSPGTTEPYGTTLQFIASVNPDQKGGLAASGSVSFYDNGTTLLGSTAISSGQGLININTLSVGGHSVTATYGGDTNFAASTSSALAISISGTSPLPTPPSNATWFYNLQETTSPGTWQQCEGTACSGGSNSGSGSLTQGISLPSLSGSSMKQVSAGSGFNVLYYKDLGCSTTPTGGTNTTGTLTITVATPTTTSNSISINASASDTTYTVTSIQVYLDNDLVFDSSKSGPVTPISYTMSGLTSGSHSVVTKAWDSHGTSAAVSSTIVLGGVNCSSVSNYLDDLWFYIDPSTTHLQALEFDPDMTLNGWTYSPSMQCDSASGDWRYWNESATGWVDSGLSCTLLISTGTWHHFQLYSIANTTAHTYTYKAFVVDGVTVYSNPANATFSAKNNGWANNIWVQEQIDNNSSAGTNTVYYDSYTFTTW